MNHTSDVFQPLQQDDPAVVAGYRLAARLGAGGMGRVYLSHTQGGRPVAIKVVRPELADDPGFLRRFRHEMEAARRVRGAYTAELIDGDADGAPPWLATLYVPGPSLAEAVARRGPLPVPALLWLTAGVAEALQAIHAVGIVHRDLKPSNVLLAADGPRVIDFGISVAADGTSYTATGVTIGTPQFMAPEQAAGGPVTAATDVFSLAQTVAFAALGTSLYGDGPAVSVLYRIVHSEPDLSALPPELRPLLARCLAADPAQRATPAEVVEWCRERLGQDADAGTVWREVTGPPLTVPSPVRPLPSPAAPSPAPPTLAHPTVTQPRPNSVGPNSPWQAPTYPADPHPRSRRAKLLTGAAVTAGVLVLSVLAWAVMDATGTFDSGRGGGHGVAKGAGTGTSADASSPSPSASRITAGSGSGSERVSGAGADAASSPPVATPYPGLWLDEKDSLNIKDGVQRKDRKGDIRFTCAKETSCALEATTRGTVIAPVYGKPGTGLDDCRAWLAGKGADTRLPLAIITTGSEICFKHPDGYIGLFVVETKSTALPKSGISFLSGALTVWRDRS
ncbi:serine/threonine protein kinase [Streptomyces sp. SID14478]|uniref:serine/threonine-protein kinase n=1 Tax=Streptomyces sp. SID14478 TaxID=2706073 RepID=UPI0013D9A71F|nr:serine/threonine-protein kinase [Streptomyces sp. SID14478]NEB74401.1 serine/threonine protein kinase [Streptomyces sp. SID14478]